MSNLIDAHLEWCKMRGFSERTTTKRGELLRRMDRDLPFGIEEVTVEELQHWLAGHGKAAWTRCTFHSHVTEFYRWTVRFGHLDWDPSADLPRPRAPRCVPRPVTSDQLDWVLTVADNPLRLWAILAARAGLRCMEIANLLREEITEEDMLIHGKGRKTRVVPTHPDVWASVRALPPGPIARRITDGEPASAQYVSETAWRQLHDLGVPASLHRLRHWFGTETYRRSLNLRAVQELMGHASINTTAGYTLVTDEERREVIRALPTVAAGS